MNSTRTPSSDDPGSSYEHATTDASGSAGAFDGVRASRRRGTPRAASSRATAPPIAPVDPVTAILVIAPRYGVASAPAPTEVVVMRLTQVALYAEDLARARRFYEELTGTTATGEFDPPGLLFLDLDGTRLLLESAAPRSMLYLQVDDVREAVTRLPAGAIVA